MRNLNMATSLMVLPCPRSMPWMTTQGDLDVSILIEVATMTVLMEPPLTIDSWKMRFMFRFMRMLNAIKQESFQRASVEHIYPQEKRSLAVPIYAGARSKLSGNPFERASVELINHRRSEILLLLTDALQVELTSASQMRGRTTEIVRLATGL